MIAHDAPLPEVGVGDLLAVLDTGAYGYCMSGHFINRLRPPEVFVDEREALLGTRRETFEDLIAVELEIGAMTLLRVANRGSGGRL